MQKLPIRGALLDHCRPCNAVWLDAGELEALETGGLKSEQRLARERRTEEATEQTIATASLDLCPRCQGVLRPSLVRGVEVDECRRCGGCFLDHGELTLLLRPSFARTLSRLWRGLRGL